ncbi:MAG TPA: polyprenyl synthetase family protein [Flavobacteriales bacterium]|nr:polyprenyl synthetase family protein [Flavobacteriales bacterium]
MSIVSKIKYPIKDEMKLFEKKFKQSLQSKVPLLDRIMHYIIKRKGKQMRPMFVFLTAQLFGEVNDKSYRAASLIELLHTATLVHDDVVDEANLRRGFFSVNALWKNKIAVLVGDFLLSKGLLLSVENEDYDLLKIVSSAVKDMSEGELLQIEKARKLDIEESVYFDIIRKKTAVLISSCCACGASSMNQNKEIIKKLYLFGEKAGIAFQIKDDLFDYTQSSFIGKPTGIDIREQKMTLPLIYTLNNVDKKTKNGIINTVKNDHKNVKKVSDLIELVKNTGGLKYASEIMKNHQKEALTILSEFPDSDAKNSLELLVDYVINRKK